MDDYESIDYSRHYEATVEHEERIVALEKKMRQIEHKLGLK